MVDHRRLRQEATGTRPTVNSDTVIWRLTDGKRGHERQTEGLAAALEALIPASVYSISVNASALKHFYHFCRSRFPNGASFPRPHLIVGAGRACQWPLLAARRACGGRCIYLMRPSLPIKWFDLCIIPRHDDPRISTHVIVSEGPLNPIRPTPPRVRQTGLILIGGSSRHYRWNTRDILQQVTRITEHRPDISWQICDSRRTPDDLRAALTKAKFLNAEYLPHDGIGRDWLPTAMQRSRYIWVSADSVAMIYEALTSGALVGFLDVPVRRRSRVTELTSDLKARKQIACIDDWLELGAMNVDSRPLNESHRCAQLVAERWPEICNRKDMS